MKIFFLIIGLLIVCVGGFFVYSKLHNRLSNQQVSENTNISVTLVGVLKNGKGDDYTHIISSNGKLIGVASYTLKLDEYVGKQVEITGQYSGTTLYADTIKVQ